MKGYIRKARGWEKQFGKYVVGNKTEHVGVDIVDSPFIAIRYCLWHSGVHPKIAFFKFKYLWRKLIKSNSSV